MTVRLERAKQAAGLRAQGKTIQGIAIELGISRSYANDLLQDPDGSAGKARKRSYRGTCVDCGSPTDGSNGPRQAAKRCAKCAATHQHETRQWTRETIIEAFRRYHDERGYQPSAMETMITRPGPWFPPVTTVQREFGSWSNAIRACGWKPWSKRNGGTMQGGPVYVILKQNGDDSFHVAGKVEAATRDHALRRFLAELPETKRSGVWATVPGSQWKPRKVRLVMLTQLVFDGQGDTSD